MSLVTNNPVNTALTGYVIQGLAKRMDFTGLRVAPGHGQASIRSNYPVIELADGEMLRNNMEPRKPGTNFKRMEAEIGLDQTELKGDGLDIVVPQEVYEDAMETSSLDTLAVYAEESFLNALRLHEVRVAALAQGAGFDAVNSGVPYTVPNRATVDFPQDLDAAIDRVEGRGEYADTVVIPQSVWTRLRSTDLLRSFIAGSVNPGALVTPQNLAAAFADRGIKRVLIGRARENTAAKKQVNIQPIWANTHIWVGAADPTGTSEEVLADRGRIRSAMKTFFWDKVFGAPFVVKTYYNEDIESYIVRAWGHTDTKLVNARAGTRITTQFA